MGKKWAPEPDSYKFFRSEILAVQERHAAVAGLGQHEQSGFFRIPPHIILHHKGSDSGQYLAVPVLRQQRSER